MLSGQVNVAFNLIVFKRISREAMRGAVGILLILVVGKKERAGNGLE